MAGAPNQSAINRFTDLVGAAHVLTGGDDMASYLREWRDKYQGRAAGVLRPKSVEELQAIVGIANEEGIALVPQGGNTGLVGAQIAFDAERQFVVNLSRMNRIRQVDPDGYTMTVEAGVILKNAQEAAYRVDRLFPLSLGSEGSCQIGGNLSSNAGGTGVLAYGNARDLTLGLEVVLPSGEVMNELNRLRKNNTGYDLKNLFIGAEGTLGFITAAVLKLFSKPRGRQTAFVAFRTLDEVAAFYTSAQAAAGQMLTAFELMPRIGIEFLVKHIDGARDPIAAAYPWYALLEISSGQSQDHAEGLMMSVVGDGMETQKVSDGALAQSEAQNLAFWRLRHELSHCQKPEGGSIKHDVSVPVATLPAYLREVTDAVLDLIPGCRPVPFGHWGDGNVHFNVSQPVGEDRETFLNRWEDMNDLVHAITVDYGGSISAEHGIGVMKRDTLRDVKDPVSLGLMRQIKETLDPNCIMNPGKVL
ncbi:MAG: FAD-binding oxidoreductase [Pseudomonadota bacterium]